jgi:hypothetical protein
VVSVSTQGGTAPGSSPRFGWCIVVDGSNEEYVSSYCHFDFDAQKLIEGKEHWHRIVYWKDALKEFNVETLEQLLTEEQN